MKGEGVHVITVYPGATDTPMMKTSKAGPELGFVKETTSAVANAIVEGIEGDAFEVVRGGETREKMITEPGKPCRGGSAFLDLRPALAVAVRDQTAL